MIGIKNADCFSSLHPVVNFLYFAFVIGFSMCFMHPICLGISLVTSAVYCFYLSGDGESRQMLAFSLPVTAMAVVTNPAFNHEGATILIYLPSGNPLTLESILYGLAAGTMLMAVLLWFSCFNRVITSDKFVYLFGRAVPALSLILSMTLRFVPRFRGRIRQASAARQCMYGSAAGLKGKLKNAVTLLSVAVTWSLENAVETADSMKSRGYGLKGRTAFSVYRFDRRDSAVLAWLLVCGLTVVIGWITGSVQFRYYPLLQGNGGSFRWAAFAMYAALCATPLILDRREDRAWKHFLSII